MPTENWLVPRVEKVLEGVRALLFDLDGTLYQSEEAIPGASEALSAHRAQGYLSRFVTSTTSRCRATLAERLARLGILVEMGDLFAPP